MCMCVHKYAYLSACVKHVCVRVCVCVCVCALHVCVWMFFCFALGCWVMGPAGRAEAIHFPSATLKAANGEGGNEGEGRRKRAERIKSEDKKKHGVSGGVGWGVFTCRHKETEKRHVQSDKT